MMLIVEFMCESILAAVHVETDFNTSIASIDIFVYMCLICAVICIQYMMQLCNKSFLLP